MLDGTGAQEAKRASQALSLGVRALAVQGTDQLEPTIQLVTKDRPGALLVANDSGFMFRARHERTAGHRRRAVASALRGFRGERCPSLADYVTRIEARDRATAAGWR